MKKFYQSKTFWIATAQAAIGIICVLTDAFPSAQWLGGAVILKSMIDVVLRVQTSTKLSLK